MTNKISLYTLKAINLGNFETRELGEGSNDNVDFEVFEFVVVPCQKVALLLDIVQLVKVQQIVKIQHLIIFRKEVIFCHNFSHMFEIILGTDK